MLRDRDDNKNFISSNRNEYTIICELKSAGLLS